MNTSALTISPVQQEDEDEYYCVASNNLKDESKTAVVAVIFKTTGSYSYSVYIICLCDLTIDKLENSTDDYNCANETIGIAVLSILLAVAVVCIVGLIMKNLHMSKKLAQDKSNKT